MLVAPAGYGKTTLAGQWLASRPHAWYRATRASADVAALATGLARAAAEITRADLAPIAQYLERTPDPEADLEALNELVADTFHGWPSGTWFAVDEYEALAGSRPAEFVTEAIAAAENVNLLVISRLRPTWATARRLLYGELFELGRHDLAMDASEAAQVLERSRRSAPGLVAIAEGWPAVIGLASLAEAATAPEEAMADALYEFFAEELLRTFEPTLREQLYELAVAPTITAPLAETLFGGHAPDLLREATRAGFLNVTGSETAMHPLLRQFLLTKFRELPQERRHEALNRTFQFLVEGKEWDEAFSVLETFDVPALTEDLVTASLGEMLRAGRISTLKRWFEFAYTAGQPAPPAAGVLGAEIAFRQGQHAIAEIRAAQAAADLPPDHPLRQRAWLRAGQAAYFAERYEQALAYLEQSIEIGGDPSLEREARWIAFIAALDGERPDALLLLERFAALRERSVDHAVRMSNARLLVATRHGCITEAVAAETATAHLVHDATDPMIRSAFLNIYAWALALNAQYREASAVVNEERREAEAHHLSFVVPHADLLGGLCAVGLRELEAAASLLGKVREAACAHDDVFLRLSAAAVTARLAIARGSAAEAVVETSDPQLQAAAAARSAWYDCLSIRAVALAASGAVDDARSLADDVLAATSHAEIRSSAVLALAICALSDGESEEAEEAVERALSLLTELGEFDSLVTAYRAFPPLVIAAARVGYEEVIVEIAMRANDSAIARRYGLLRGYPQGQATTLSPREEQVLELAAEGRTNQEIARLLFISTVTVKAHLRHIYEKLGVRNRVEAAHVVRQRQRAL